jgi:uncharacterized membrane protein YesL
MLLMIMAIEQISMVQFLIHSVAFDTIQLLLMLLLVHYNIHPIQFMDLPIISIMMQLDSTVH